MTTKRERVYEFADKAGVSREEADGFIKEFGLRDALQYFENLPIAAIALGELEANVKNLLTGVYTGNEIFSRAKGSASKRRSSRMTRVTEYVAERRIDRKDD